MPKTNDTLPTIRAIHLKELVIDPLLSGRTAKEITANAKALAPALEAFGGWDASQPGAVTMRDGKPHLVRGFCRVAAADLAGIKTGCFIEVPDEPVALRTEAIRSNMGKPISQHEQGRIYVGMRNGTDLTQPVPVGTAILEPMTPVQIADELGYSRVHIDSCIGIFEETPEIGALIAEEKVSANVVTRAKQLVKADVKRLNLLKAAASHAAKQGRTTATPKDLDAVKAEFVPLKADTAKSPKKPDAKKEEPDKSAAKPSAQSTMDLASPKVSKKTIAQTRQGIIDVLEACDDELDAADAERYAEALVKAGCVFAASPL